MAAGPDPTAIEAASFNMEDMMSVSLAKTAPTMSRGAFMAALERNVVATHTWAASDPARCKKFMDLTRQTLESDRAQYVAIDGASFAAAWKEIGGKGKPTYKALRALPHDDATEIIPTQAAA